MKTLRFLAIAAAIALPALGAASLSEAQEEGAAQKVEVSVLGGAQALNQNDTALPDNFINIPLAAAATYHLSSKWALEGELSWLVPVKRSVDLGAAGSQDRKTPDVLTYQANVVGGLPLSGTPWKPYLTAGLGAVTFLSNTDADRYPQLPESQTAFAINFGAGATYGLSPRWGLRADFREFAAFPSKDAKGLSTGGKADPIWMERGTIGLAYRF